MKSQEETCLLYIHVHSLLQLICIQWTPDYPNPSGQPIAQVWWIIETVWINEMIKVMIIDNFPVVCNRVTETRNTPLHLKATSTCSSWLKLPQRYKRSAILWIYIIIIIHNKKWPRKSSANQGTTVD